MADLKNHFREADRIPAPDLWPNILAREPGRPPAQPRWHRIATVVLALAVAGLGVFLLARSFLPRIQLHPGGSIQPRPSETPTPEPVAKANGRIAFVRSNPKTAFQEGGVPESAIYTVEPDGTGLVRLVGGVSYRSTPAWSPDGSRIAFDRPDGIYVMDSDGSNISQLVECKPQDCEGIGSPAWAPDGSQIAFPSTRGGIDGLWVVGVNGAGLAPIRQNLAILGSPAWSPDGREIAVSGYLEGAMGQSAIYMVSAETGDVVRTISVEGIEFGETVAWSPDGRWLVAFATGKAGSPEGEGIYLMRPDGTDVRLLTACPSSPECIDVYPAWSPDGQEIVFTRGLCTEPGSDCFTGDLETLNIQEGRPTPLTSESALDCCPSWQPIPEASPSVTPSA